jgi:hypothetical protein
MKKLLSIFGAIGLVVTPMSSFSISCSSPKSLPHYNSDGDFNEQVSDAWDTSILKTVSTWIIPQDTPNELQAEENDTNPIMEKITLQIVDLIQYRFENWREITSDITNKISTIQFYKDATKSFPIKDDATLTEYNKNNEWIYFSLDDGKTFLDLSVTSAPLARDAFNFLAIKDNNDRFINGELRFNGAKFKSQSETWNKSVSGDDTRNSITKDFIKSIADNSIVTLTDSTILAKDYFAHSFNSGSPGSPAISSFENELLNQMGISEWEAWLCSFMCKDDFSEQSKIQIGGSFVSIETTIKK